MKIKKKKFVLGTLLTTCSLAIVSSITSTFAWYSYNTKNGMAFTGVATGDTESLQVKLGNEDDTKWRTTLTKDEVAASSEYYGYSTGNLAPVTQAMGIGRSGSDAKLGGTAAQHYGFYGAPTYLVPKCNQNNLKDSSGKYVFFRTTLQFRCIDPLDETQFYAKGIYISFLDVKATGTEDPQKDITQGLRMHITQGTSTFYTIAPGYATSKDFNLTGPLNLAGSTEDGATDKGIRTSGDKGSPDATYRTFIPDFDDPDDLEEVTYGNKKDAKELCLGTDDVVSTFVEGKLSSSKIKIGETTEDGTPVNVELTIWLEGWDPAVINSNIGAEFAFGIQFEVEKL